MKIEKLQALAAEIVEEYGEEPLADNEVYFAAFGRAYCTLIAHNAAPEVASKICFDLLGDMPIEDPSDDDDEE